MNQGHRFLRLSDVIARTSLSRTTIWRMCKEGTFPSPIKIGQNSTAWLAAEIDGWAEERIGRRSDGAQKTASSERIACVTLINKGDLEREILRTPPALKISAPVSQKKASKSKGEDIVDYFIARVAKMARVSGDVLMDTENDLREKFGGTFPYVRKRKMGALHDRDALVLYARSRKMSAIQIAKLLGMTKRRVRQILANADQQRSPPFGGG